MLTLEDMKKAIKADHETKNLNISDLDVVRVYRYLLERDKDHQETGFYPVLLTDPYIEIVYRPTQEKLKEIRQARIRQYLKFFDSELYIQDASLDDFYVNNESRKKAHLLATDFLETYRKDRYAKGLYIYGMYRTGKSYLLSAIAKALAEQDFSVLFVYMPDLVRSIRQGMNEGNLEERINRLKQADVLMLDDFGGENISMWFRDEVIVPVLQYRLSAQLPVFVSSNFDYTQLLNAMMIDRNDINRSKAVRLLARIKDLMTPVQLAE
ncbi:MAG: ATP-binding protein [Acholeplasmataceae bacterium]